MPLNSRILWASAALLLPLSACDKDSSVDSSPQTDDSQAEPVELSCSSSAADTPISSGSWAAGIDSALFNDCENSAGKGLHIHVNEDTILNIDASQSPALSAISDPDGEQAMAMTGSIQEGGRFTLTGIVELEMGTCIVGVEAVMSGQMTGPESFCYQMDATAFVSRELSPDACSLIIGETEDHTFSALPCEQAWEGLGRPVP